MWDADDVIPIIGIVASALITFLKKDEKKEKKKKRNLSVNKSQPIKAMKEEKKDINEKKEIIKEQIQEQLEVPTVYEEEVILKEEKKDEIQRSEIGRENFILNQNDLIKGVILSEILDKPKALRKKL
ncbi:hypothetical protein [Inediibacterium massiliense]|uniref:hypothetical protein n=1 Tax=Inediibacterium massiliense TaxID=1658111 RepID=UPI0006B6466E|nr:hypothetical protein [Inediibacterium massiliense]